MGWRESRGLCPTHNFSIPRKTYTKHTEPPEITNGTPGKQNIVCFVEKSVENKKHAASTIPTCPQVPQPVGNSTPPFQIGEQVSYRTPVNIRSGLWYDWETRTGLVQGFDHVYQLVMVRPDNHEPMIQIAVVYVKKII